MEQVPRCYSRFCECFPAMVYFVRMTSCRSLSSLGSWAPLSLKLRSC
jgi:hypothetical protein